MIDVKYPDRPVETYRIVWEGDWILKIEGLPDSEFVCFDEHDKSFYDDAIKSDHFEIVILLNSKKQILKMRSLSPCVYTEEFREIKISARLIAKIDRKAQSVVMESKEYLRQYGERLNMMALKFACDMLDEITKDPKKGKVKK